VSENLEEKVVGASDVTPAKAEPAKAKVLKDSTESPKRTVAKGGAAPTGAKDTAPTGAKDGTLGAKD
jgi:hypothetical protein